MSPPAAAAGDGGARRGALASRPMILRAGGGAPRGQTSGWGDAAWGRGHRRPPPHHGLKRRCATAGRAQRASEQPRVGDSGPPSHGLRRSEPAQAAPWPSASLFPNKQPAGDSSVAPAPTGGGGALTSRRRRRQRGRRPPPRAPAPRPQRPQAPRAPRPPLPGQARCGAPRGCGGGGNERRLRPPLPLQWRLQRRWTQFTAPQCQQSLARHCSQQSARLRALAGAAGALGGGGGGPAAGSGAAPGGAGGGAAAGSGRAPGQVAGGADGCPGGRAGGTAAAGSAGAPAGPAGRPAAGADGCGEAARVGIAVGPALSKT